MIINRSFTIRAVLALILTLITLTAEADVNSTGLLDKVLDKYMIAATSWGTIITNYASWLFWILASISMTWTFGVMALRQADIGEFFSEFVRFTIFTGFYWWLLINGPEIARAIMESMKEIGKAATGSPLGLTPSTIIDIGFAIYGGIIIHAISAGLIQGLASIFVGLAILVALTLVSVNMLILLVSSWILAYAGIFFLGFGGSRWTSEMAIGYYRTVISIGGQLLAMVLLVGVGQSILQSYANTVSPNGRLEELGIILVIAIVLLMLVNKVPSLIGGLAMGGGSGALGGGFGAGHVVGAMAMAATAGASAVAGMVSAAANTSGALKAVQAAYRQAQSYESLGTDESAITSNLGTTTNTPTQDIMSPLAAAMGDSSSSIADQSKGENDATSNSQADTPATNSQNQEQVASPSSSDASAASNPTPNKSRDPGKPLRLALGTLGNIVSGAASMTKEAFNARVETTAGARLANYIQANTANANTPSPVQAIESNTISAGKPEAVDPADEISAFRDRPGSHEDDDSSPPKT